MEKKNIILILILFILILVFSIIKISISFSPAEKIIKSEITPLGEPREFNIKAFRFGYSPSEITVNKGDKVKIIIENTDTLHGMRIPDMGVSGNNIIEFVAEKEGEFNLYCNNICGVSHRDMMGKLIIG